MWETITALGNNKYILLLIVGIIAVVIYLIKKGYLKMNTHGVQIGLSEQQTRDLIQAQFDYANAKCESIESSLPKSLEKYKVRFIIGKVEDVIQKAIIFNNLTDNESYIKAKQELCYCTWMKYVEDDYFKTPDFHAWMNKFVNDLFSDLYRMKKLYRQGQ